MQQAYGQTYYVEQLLHQIVELLCATGNNGHSAPVYIYFLILCLYILELFTSDSIIYTNLYLFVYLLIIKMSYI